MQNATEMTGLRLSHKLEQLITSGSYPVLCVGYALGAMVAAMARIAGGAAPFGAAWLAAVPFRFTLPSTLGMALGYLISCGASGSYPYVAAGFLVTLLRWVLRPARWDSRQSWLVPLTAAGAVFAAGVLPFFYRDPLLYDVILWATQVVIAGAAAAFLCRALGLLAAGGRGSAKDTALWVLFAIGIMGLSTLQLGGVSAGRIAAAAAVLFAARVGGVVPATVTGVICGCAAGFSGGDFTLYVTLYSLGGLMAGVFGAFGRVGSTVAFSAAYGFMGLLAGGSGGNLVEMAVAAVIFLMIPVTWFKIFAAAALEAGSAATVKTLVTEQLEGTAGALRSLCATTSEVANRLGRLYTGDISGIYDRAGERVCRRCPQAMGCWQERYNDTVDALAHGLRAMMQTQAVGPDDFPEGFNHCLRKKEMGEYLAAEYLRYTHRDEERHRAAQTRRLLADQMEGIALALEDVVGGVGNICAGDSVLEAKAEALLTEHRLEPQRVVCWKNRQGRLTLLVEIPEYKEARSAPELLAAELGELCELPLAFPLMTRRGKVSRLVFYERPRYSMEYGSCQMNCGSNTVCGDSFRILNPTGAVANLLLSDGMGSGNSAAVDSAMTASLITRLLEAGMSYPAALKLINGALLAKSGEESLATVDAAQIDLYTGRVHLFKAGAAPTIVRKEGRGVEIDAASLPAGILDGVEFSESKITLEGGDLLLMCSDGATPDGSEWLARAVEGFEGGDLNQFCRKLAASARLRREGSKDDDITVLCARLTLAAK